MDAFWQWLWPRAEVIGAAVAGAIMYVSLAWTSPAMALRQLLACALAGYTFGPAMFEAVQHYTLFTSSAAQSATIGVTGLCGVYLIEGLMVLGQKWRANPILPFRKP